MSDQKEKKRVGRPPLSENEKMIRAAEREKEALSLNREENELFIGHAWAALSRPAIDLDDVKAVEQRVTEYALSCRNSGLRPNPPGLAAWLGITSAELGEWLVRPGTEEQRRMSARIYQFLHQSFADMALAGKTSPQVAIFLAKNWFSYTDATRIETASVERVKTLDDLAREAAALPDGDIIDAQVKDVKKGNKK